MNTQRSTWARWVLYTVVFLTLDLGWHHKPFWSSLLADATVSAVAIGFVVMCRLGFRAMRSRPSRSGERLDPAVNNPPKLETTPLSDEEAALRPKPNPGA